MIRWVLDGFRFLADFAELRKSFLSILSAKSGKSRKP